MDVTRERCPHDVDPRGCATCLPGSEDVLDGHVGRPFVARYDGTCSGCGFDVRPGERVRYLDGFLAHVDGGCS
jgi:hypothetical protein